MPPNSSNPYKLVTIRSPGWSAYKAATLLISVGQSYHEGDKFAVMVAWAARHFEKLHVLVADSLQRHNAPGDWRARGAAWIERNHDAWSSCGREVTVSRWDDWLAKPEFPGVLERFRAAGKGALGTGIEHDAHAFVARQAGKGLGLPVEQSREYLSRSWRRSPCKHGHIPARGSIRGRSSKASAPSPPASSPRHRAVSNGNTIRRSISSTGEPPLCARWLKPDLDANGLPVLALLSKRTRSGLVIVCPDFSAPLRLGAHVAAFRARTVRYRWLIIGGGW